MYANVPATPPDCGNERMRPEHPPGASLAGQEVERVEDSLRRQLGAVRVTLLTASGDPVLPGTRMSALRSAGLLIKVDFTGARPLQRDSSDELVPELGPVDVEEELKRPFVPVPIIGEPLSETIKRERR